MACDICGKVGTDLEELNKEYRTADIHHICPDCAKIVNSKNSKLLTFVLNIKTTLLKRFMQERKASFGR